MLTKPEFPDIAKRHDRLFTSWDMIKGLDHYERPYKWMIAQMLDRGIDTQGHPPFWAWQSYGAPGKRVDLRVYRLDKPLLRLTLEVPDDLVLISDEEDWHAVLNNWYLSKSETESDLIDALEEAGKLTQAA